MLLPNQLLLPARTFAGPRALRRLPEAALAFGPRGLLVHGRSLAHGEILTALLREFPAGRQPATYLHAGGEPTLTAVERLRQWLQARPVDWVAAVGGGSVLDLAKAAAGLTGAPDTVAAYQAGAAIPPARLPLLAVPTTAGTGSEATVVAVLTNPDRQLKQSIRHPSFMPRVVILDPDLLRSCPPATLAAAGLDALTQAFESYTSRHATPLTRSLSELALVKLAVALPAVYDGDWGPAADLLEASYLAGVALSHARLGVVHGLAHPLGVRWHAPHGLVCAACLPAALAFNAPAIGPELAGLAARLGQPFAERVDELLARFGIVSPFRGQPVRDRQAIVEETLASGSTAANPRPVARADVEGLLDAIFAA